MDKPSDFEFLFDRDAPGPKRIGVPHTPRHRSMWARGDAPVSGRRGTSQTPSLPVIKSYDELPSRPEPDPEPVEVSSLEVLLDVSTEGPAVEPLLGRRLRLWRPGVYASTFGVALFTATVTAMFALSPLTSMALDRAVAPGDTPWTAQFTKADGTTIPVADVTCRDVFDEATAGAFTPAGAPTFHPPKKVTKVKMLAEQRAAIGRLPKGDVVREVIVCSGVGHWYTGKRQIVARLSVAGGEADARSISARTHKVTS